MRGKDFSVCVESIARFLFIGRRRWRLGWFDPGTAAHGQLVYGEFQGTRGSGTSDAEKTVGMCNLNAPQ